MATPEWQIKVAEAIPRTSTGEVPLVAVFCEGVTVAEVKKFLDELDAPSPELDGGGEGPSESGDGPQCRLSVHIRLHPVDSEECDFDGVDVIASPYLSLIRAYERRLEVPAGILRAALVRLLEGEAVPSIAARLDDMIRDGYENGDPHDVTGEGEGFNVFMGKQPPAKA